MRNLYILGVILLSAGYFHQYGSTSILTMAAGAIILYSILWLEHTLRKK